MASLSAVAEAVCAQENVKEGRSHVDQTLSIAMLPKAECVSPNCASLGEFLKTVKVVEEGDAQSWLVAWKTTADFAQELAEHRRESADKDRRR